MEHSYQYYYLYRGVGKVLKKRLKNHLKKEKLALAKLEQEKRIEQVHFYCVIDFEGTCEEENPKDYIHEIIEFPVVLVDSNTLEVVSVCCKFSLAISFSVQFSSFYLLF